MREIRLGVSPITNQIYAGYVKGNIWKEKQDVTIEALMSVVNHCLRFNNAVIISKEDGTPEFEINVKDLRNGTTN